MATLEKVMQEVRTLAPDDRRRLRELLDALPYDGQANNEYEEIQRREKECEQQMLKKGVISHIPPPITDFAPYENRKLIKIEGEPLSETIIRERR